MESNEFFGGIDGLDKATKRYASEGTVVGSEEKRAFFFDVSQKTGKTAARRSFQHRGGHR
jgi:hypothetical protein